MPLRAQKRAAVPRARAGCGRGGHATLDVSET